MNVHDDSFHAILEAKYARIIKEISDSDMLSLLEDGVADLHCRSDKYLAEEIWNENKDNSHENKHQNACGN